MSAVVDSSVLIDIIRGHAGAREALHAARARSPLHGSEITRLEILMGMRPGEEDVTRRLITGLRWHPVDESVAEAAGELGRTWLPSHNGIDSADLAIAATVVLLDATLLTKNVKHFPMFDGLVPPY